MTIDNRLQTHLIDGKQIGLLLTKVAFDNLQFVIKPATLEETLRLMKATAITNDNLHEVFVRIGHDNNIIYLDLGNQRGEAVQITADGWQVVTYAPLPFLRPSGMLPLATPMGGGSVDQLRELINVPSDEDWSLCVAAMLGWFCMGISQPVLVVNGEHGSCKTSTCRFLRSIVDPHACPLRAPPGNMQDLMIGALYSSVLAYDNISRIPQWLSDGLCRISSGGGFSTRQLWTDRDEQIITVQRPILVNGIEDMVSRGDLRDRAMFINCPPINPEKRRTEKILEIRFKEVAPYVLGALLNAVSMALRRRNEFILPNPPRMADFVNWGASAEPALGWETGRISEAYRRNQAGSVLSDLNNTTIAPAVVSLLQFFGGTWEGTATELLNQLRPYIPEEIRRTHEFPANPRVLSGNLRRIAPQLRSAWGINIDFTHGQQRKIKIYRERTAVQADEGKK